MSPRPPRHTSAPHLFITHEFYPKRGGIATFVEELSRASSKLGHEIEVWAQALPLGFREKAFPFRVRRLPLRGTHDFRCVFALARVLFAERRRVREASVYLVEPGPILAFLWLQFLRAIRPRELCLTFHGSEILKLHRNPLWRALARRLIARATRVSTLTHYTRDLLFECFPEARARFVLTPGSLRRNLADAPRAECLPALAFLKKQRPLVILTVGRLHPRKGQLHTLNALAALPPELRGKIEYWLVGSAATHGAGKRYEHALRERAVAASAKASTVAPGLVIRFLGDVADDQLGAIYAQADIFALTSVAHGASVEGFGLVYLEASAHGLPIVAHDIGGVAEAVSDGHTGLLVSPDEPDALRDAFARLIEDAQLRTQLGAAGPEWARRRTWRDSAAALLGACRPTIHADATLCRPYPSIYPLRGKNLRPQNETPSKAP